MMKKFIAIICCLFMFMGCSAAQVQYTANIASIAVEVDMLKMKYDGVRTLIISKQDVFTDKEYQELLLIDATMRMLIAKIDSISDPMKSFSLNEIVYMWYLAKDGYVKSYAIVEQNWDRLLPSEQMVLLSFRSSAERADEMINNLLSNPTNENINKTIVMISGMAGIALKILPMVLI